MNYPVLYSFKRCPYAMRARMALKLANIKCELREVRLNNKPNHMLEVSPKGTVPVLILKDNVIDESIEIINWVLTKADLFKNDISQDQMDLSEEIILIFDNKFKYHLDRYKYASRFEANSSEHKEECKNILEKLDTKINPSPWIFGKKVSLLDISILPFIRQCKIANPEWFFEQNFKKVIALLNFFEASNLFIHAMKKFDLWDPQNPNGSLFP